MHDNMSAGSSHDIRMAPDGDFIRRTLHATNVQHAIIQCNGATVTLIALGRLDVQYVSMIHLYQLKLIHVPLLAAHRTLRASTQPFLVYHFSRIGVAYSESALSVGATFPATRRLSRRLWIC